MADIKKFTGYITDDGETHDTMAKATKHTVDMKVKIALDQFKHLPPVSGGQTFLSEDAGPCVLEADMPAFLFANRDAIMAAYKQTANMRSPRKPGAPKAPRVPKVKSSVTVVPENPLADNVSVHEGVLQLEE